VQQDTQLSCQCNDTDILNRLQCLNHLLCSGLSAALFAPAWVWEVGNQLDWLQRQQQFWDKIEACWEAPRALVCQLPFSTCFDQGAGSARFSEVSLTHRSCTSTLAHCLLLILVLPAETSTVCVCWVYGGTCALPSKGVPDGQ